MSQVGGTTSVGGRRPGGRQTLRSAWGGPPQGTIQPSVSGTWTSRHAAWRRVTGGQRPGDAGLNRTSSRGHRGRRTCGEHRKGPHGSSAGRPHARPRAASPGTSRVVQTGWPGPRAWSSGPRRPRASRGPGVPRAPLRPSAPCSLSHLTLAVIPVREVLTPVDSGCLGRPQRGSSSPVVRHGVAGLGPVSAARPSGPAAPSDSQDS